MNVEAAAGLGLISIVLGLLLIAYSTLAWVISLAAARASARRRTAPPVPPPAGPQQGPHPPPGPPHMTRPAGPPPPGAAARAPLAYPGQPGAWRPADPATASGPAAPADRTALYLNILLGVAALLMITAAIIFITVASSTVVKAVSLWVVALIFYATGLLVYAFVTRLRPVGFALTAIGLAIIPVAGFGLGGWQLTSGTLAWFISSAAGVLAYLGAAFVLRSQIITWLSVAFAFSLTMSAIALTPAPVVWYFVVLILTTAPLALLARLLRGRLAEKFIRPQLILGDVLAPLAVAGAIFIRPVPSRLEWGILFAALGVHFLVGALLRGSALRGALARLSFAAAALLVISGAAVNGFAGLSDGWNRPLTSAAAFLFAAAFFAEAGLRRPARAASSSDAPAGSGVLAKAAHVTLVLAGGFLCAVGIVVADASLSGPGQVAATLLVTVAGLIAAAAAVFADLRADLLLPLGAGVAVAVRIGALVIYVIMNTGPRHASVGHQLPAGVATSAGFVWNALLLTGLAWLSWVITSRRARHLRTLRAGMPILMPAAAFFLLMPAPMAAADIDSPLSALIVLAALAALGLCAWWARNALLLVGVLPVALAFGYVVGDVWAAFGLGSSVTMHIIVPSSLLVMAAAISGASIAEVRLHRSGRTWRARYALIAAVILAFFLGTGLLATILVPGAAVGFAEHAAIAVIPLPAVAVFAGGHWIARRLALATPARPGLSGVRRRSAELRLLPLSIAAALTFLTSVVVIIVHVAQQTQLISGLALVVLAAIAFTHAFGARVPEVVLLGFLALAQAVRTFAGLAFEDKALTHLLAAWLVWLLAYGLFWLISSTYDRRPGARHLFAGFSRWSLAPLIAAFLAMLTAFLSALFVDAQVPALNSLTMLIAGITLMMPALMLVLLAQRIPHQLARHITAEAATYIGALGGMITLAGIWQLRLVVPLHLLLAATIGWAAFHSRRQPADTSGGARFVRVDLRTVIPMALITLTGAIAAFTAGDPAYSVLFLIDHVALLVAGAVLLRAWALWWGLAGVSAGIVWFLRDLMWLALVIIAVFIIGVVIWQLLRKPKSPDPAPPSAPPAPPRAAPQGPPPPPAPPQPPGQVPGGASQPPPRERYGPPPGPPPPTAPPRWQGPR